MLRRCRYLPGVQAWLRFSLALWSCVIFWSGAWQANASWQTLNGARLVTSNSNDGDSFRAVHQGKTYIFRLYGADCPETEMSFPDRVLDQAVEFGVAVEETVEWGHRASLRTAQMLASPFRVVTRWEDALGRSSLPRHYAYILPSGGGDLAATLLSEGLARARGKSPPPPEGFPRVGSGVEYQQIQSQAKGGRRGVWGRSGARGGSHQSEKTGGSERQSERVDVNTALAGQLDSLPGIGEVLAERIISNRPYSKESDLLRVPGIGQERLRQIRDKISFSQ